jgi:RNA-dependent RNA polymerase
MLIRKVIVTPTRILCMPATVELGNRVLRHFHQHGDRFLRVTFADENLSKYLDGPKVANEVLARIGVILRDGITMFNRTFDFLAFSSSQLREHSCWCDIHAF